MYNTGSKNYNVALALLSALFFMWGLMTTMVFELSQEYKVVFSLSDKEILLIQFCFFGAYLLVSYPAAKYIDSYGYKSCMVFGCTTSAVGCLIFFLAAEMYSVHLLFASTFAVGAGITMLQVSANTYVALLGMRGFGASKLTFAQAFNSLGTFIAIFFSGSLFMIFGRGGVDSLLNLDPKEYKGASVLYVEAPYLVIGVLMLFFAFSLMFSKIPHLDTSRFKPLNVERPRSFIFQYKQVFFGAIAIFCYVGAEMSIYKHLASMYSKQDNLIWLVPVYLGTAVAGRFSGAAILRKISPRKCMVIYPIGALILISAYVILQNHSSGVWILACTGFFNSVLFPCIFTMGIDGMGSHTEEASAVLNMSIVGGAAVPFAVSTVGLNYGILLIFICYFSIAYFGLYGSRYKKRTNFY
ncbi:MAG: MFS transporter [Cytophagaceae bacterium]|nr:MFS transporter [Cytophagaceae bacterium]MDW8456658.1 MFS transporter [Cytophagaceae bacterium]